MQCQAHLPPVLLFVFFSRVKLKARAAIAAAVRPGLPPLDLLCMLPGHRQQVLRDGCFGLLEGFHQVAGVLIFIRRNEGDGCALVAGTACSMQQHSVKMSELYQYDECCNRKKMDSDLALCKTLAWNLAFGNHNGSVLLQARG